MIEINQIVSQNEISATKMLEVEQMYSKLVLDDVAVLDNRYMIEKTIFRGEGYSKINLALDLEKGQYVAIKILKSLFARSPFNSVLLENELNSMKSVNHPNCIKSLRDNINGKKIGKKRKIA